MHLWTAKKAKIYFIGQLFISSLWELFLFPLTHAWFTTGWASIFSLLFAFLILGLGYNQMLIKVILLFTIFILRPCCPILFCARHPFAPQSLRLKQKKLPPTSTFQPWPDFQALPWYFLCLWRTGQYVFPSCYFNFNFYLSRWHQHPHWVHSCACPSRRAGSPKGGIQFLYTAHHPNG